ncbi:MAG TPA: metal-dependent transcriptional regulator [Phycisphaerales bacterium]|nr:metal-dependent transcriptional regulator [Phycisphaerales bacterium]
MATETVENYLKALLTLCDESPTGEAGLARLAALLGVTKGTATSMVKRLSEGKLVKAERYGGITLTPKGRRAATDVIRRHRLIETFLVRTLKLDWSVVHAEAERLEHAVSPTVIDAIDALLGHPSVDPHGDPIPDNSGRLRAAHSRPLSACATGERVRVARVTDQEGAFLAFAARHGLRPGARVAVLAADAQAQSMLVQAAGCESVSLAAAAAAKIAVESAGKGG